MEWNKKSASFKDQMKLLMLLPCFLACSLTAIPELLFMNVGEGNCTIYSDDDELVIIDAGSMSHPLGSSKEQRITEIVQAIECRLNPDKRVKIIVSHGDKDHYGWIPLIVNSLIENGKLQRAQISMVLGGSEKD